VSRPPIPKPRARSTVKNRFDSIPLLDLHRQYEQIRDEVLTALERVCASQRFILGPEVEAIEREIEVFVGGATAVGCSSGTDAIWLALAAAGIQPGDAVITSAFSFFASASAIIRAGARPVLVDVDPMTLNLDPEQARDRLDSGGDNRVHAILPVHLYGQCADMDRLRHVADEFQVVIIEDAAQALGGKWREGAAGSMGTAAAFSFYPSKNLSAYGEAGLVTTHEEELAERLRRLRNHGMAGRYRHEEIGWNCRMDAMQAAVLRVKLRHINEWNQQRRLRASAYDDLFKSAGLSRGGSERPVQLPGNAAGALHVFHQYVIRVRRRDELRTFLSERNIGTEVYYPIPLHLQECFAYLGYAEGDLPEAERAAAEVLALPMFPELTEGEQEWVVESIAEFYA